jgi:NTE family protein
VIPVHVIATGVQGLRVFLSKGPAIDAILATGHLPSRSNRRADADRRRNRCQHPHSGGGRPRSVTIIVLPTGYACSLKEFPKGSLARHLHSMTLLIAWQLIRDLDWCPDE